MTKSLSLPPAYAWLAEHPGTSMLRQALPLYGLLEAPGAADNPVILGWVREISAISPVKARGVEGYKHDAQPWCGLVMAVIAARAGHEFPDYPLWALNWAGFGTNATAAPALGDVLTFKRYDEHGKLIGGHVGLYVGEDPECFHVFGGNQSDGVNIMRMRRERLHRAGRPILDTSGRPVILAADGAISTNEA